MAKKRKSKSKKPPVCKMPTPDTPNGDRILPSSDAAVSMASVCRLCESRVGPLLDIFGEDKDTAKKIEELMPFRVAENDDLPQKICFRCSAKLEELFEYVQKCIKSQQNQYHALGKEFSTLKSKTHRSIWEQKLNQSNITNDYICDELVKKAMEGIKDIPSLSSAESKENKINQNVEKVVEPETRKKVRNIADDNKSEGKVSSRDSVKLCIKRCDPKLPERTSRSKNNDLLFGELTPKTRKSKSSQVVKDGKEEKAIQIVDDNTNQSPKNLPEAKDPKQNSEQDLVGKNVDTKPFDIMDHVSSIKVNGVGFLFQCRLCNRNFLKEDVILSHWCAKNGTAKEDFIKKPAPPEPPKIPLVKYINTKLDSKKPQDLESRSQKPPQSKILEEELKKVPESKPKPKIGPASKIKQRSSDAVPATSVITSQTTTSSECVVPNISCRYKLVPGPHNTFTLIEAENKKNSADNKYTQIKRKHGEEFEKDVVPQKKILRTENVSKPKPNSKAVDSEEQPRNVQPYPVGLFKTLNRPSDKGKSSASKIVPFTVSPEMKQSYTVVKTNNPSKILISTKPKAQIEEELMKKSKKHEPSVKSDQPFSVTLDDNNQSKDADPFFHFINVDPLLQPSYVLPTDNTTQISTSAKQNVQNTQKSKIYSCNMCTEIFTREQKLLAHIQSHYNKLDEEDQTRGLKQTQKRGRKFS